MPVPKPCRFDAILFHDFAHADDLHGPLQCVSYGDASYTLIPVESLCAELETRDDGKRLLAEMRAVPVGTLIALNG